MDVRKKIAVISANLGSFDKPLKHASQHSEKYEVSTFLWTDENFPPRSNAMTPRLQARIPKMTSWQMLPDYDYYLWVDSSCHLAREDSVDWFMDQIGDKDFAFFRHNKRNTVGEEAEYLKERLAKDCPYVTPRYAGERLDDQMEVVDPNEPLFATTAFIYKNDTPARDALTIWWLHTSLYHSIDQLSIMTAIRNAGATYNVIDEDYLKCEYIEYTRPGSRNKK